MNWYYESAGQQQGPVADSELDRLLAGGQITQDTLVWREGMPGWTPLRTARPSAPPPVQNIEDSDPGWEVTRPGTSTAAQPSPTQGSDVPQPGWVRCSLTGRYFPPSEIIYLEGKPYSAAAKPQVVASMQSGAVLPVVDAGNRNGPAWEHRQQLGFMKAIIETVKAVLFEPTRTFSAMRREGGLQDPLIFNLIVGSIGGIVAQVLFGSLQMALPGLLGGQAGAGNAAAMMGASAVGMVMGIIMVPVQVAMGAFIWSGVLHVCLMMLKGAQQPFETTFRVTNYANGAMGAVQLIPVIGVFAAIPWSIVCTAIGLARAHEISTGKAVLAVLLPLIVCICIGVAFLAGIMTLGAAGAAASSR